ncbi:MAG: hypothetical protein WC829_24465 [Hyphomicrobium sp.]|jgi:hypothetical protein
MRPGYFKVDKTDRNAMLIFPGAFVGNTPIIELRSWLDFHGVVEPIIYRAPPVAVPITQNGVTG